jgi:glyoxylase-like metal-dependent hydrolase (beta-lactamase superfamily II)
VSPTMLIQDEGRIDLGGRVLTIKAHPVAHTDCDLSLLDAETGTLFPSDLLFVQRIPSLDGSLPGWLAELEALHTARIRRAVPGHGPASVDLAAATVDLKRYLEVLLRETRQAIARGVEIDAAPGVVAQSERGKWALFEEYHGRNVTQAFKELEWE